MSRWVGGWVNEWLGRGMDELVSGWMHRWVNEWLDKCVVECVDREWVGGWMDEMMSGWMDGIQACKQSPNVNYIHKDPPPPYSFPPFTPMRLWSCVKDHSRPEWPVDPRHCMGPRLWESMQWSLWLVELIESTNGLWERNNSWCWVLHYDWQSTTYFWVKGDWVCIEKKTEIKKYIFSFSFYYFNVGFIAQ